MIVDTSQDLSVTWLPISIGQIHVELVAGQSIGGGAFGSIACMFDGSSGSGSVSRMLLSSLKGIATTPAYFNMRSELDASSVVDGLTVTTRSYQNSTTANDSFNLAFE